MPGDAEKVNHEQHGTLVTATRNNIIDSAKLARGKHSVVYSSFPSKHADEEELFNVGKFVDINKSVLPEGQRQLISNLTHKQGWERDTSSSNVMDE
jgi:hypothetical protein